MVLSKRAPVPKVLKQTRKMKKEHYEEISEARSLQKVPSEIKTRKTEVAE